MNGYKLSRNWFNYCYENPEKVKPIHTALYFFAVEHCNRLGWKEKFSLPTEMTKEAIGVKSWHTYIKAFNDIIDWGFFKLVEKSKNQYSANIIALLNFNEAPIKAYDEALTKHMTKHCSITHQSIDSIIKLITNKQITIEQLTKKQIGFLFNFLNKKKDGQVKNDATGFETFWLDYHQITRLSKTDKDAAAKKWKGLNEKEKELAISNIKNYYDSLTDKKYCKKARTYLENKNFNDEFKPSVNNNRNLSSYEYK